MAIRNIWQRKARSILTVLGIATSVMLYIYMSVIMNWYDQDIQRQLSGLAGKVVVRARSSQDAGLVPGTSVIPQAEAGALLGQAGVDPQLSTPVLFQALVANPAPNMPPSVMAVGLLPGREESFRANTATAGATGLGGPAEVILGAKAAKHYGKATGDDLILQDEQFHVVGVLAAGNELVDSGVIMPLATAQRVFVRPGVVSAVYLTAARADQVEALAESVQAAFPKLEASTPAGMARAAKQMLTAQRAFFAGIKGTVVAVSGIVITIVMVMAVGERKKEFGTLKALGARSGTILRLVAGEALLLSLAGGLLAIPVSWLRFLNSQQQVDAGLVVQTLVLTAAVGILAALWPAWSAMRVDPLESLRHE